MTVLMNVDLRVALALMERRRESLRRTDLLASDREMRRPVRRWIGRQLVRLGAWMAAEPAMRPARAR
jgi:hypothetical protein